jgi:hypothetical protein
MELKFTSAAGESALKQGGIAMKKHYSPGITVVISLFALLCVTTTLVTAGETWDKVKKGTKNTKMQTELKMMRSKYKDKIQDEYTRLGQLIYENLDLQEQIAKNQKGGEIIKKLDLLNKKIEKCTETIKIIDDGQDVTERDIDDIKEGIGLEEESSSSGETGKENQPTPAATPAQTPSPTETK